jgi:hypothetical protein
MGTRSTIALEFADGTVEQVYCHWDGYLSNNGQILQEHYSDPFKLRELIDLGDLSSLRPEVGASHPFSQFDTTMTTEQFDALYGNMCTFYGRDRKETGISAKKFANFTDYLLNHQYEEYEYILRNVEGKATWMVADHSNRYVFLEQALENQKEEA